MKNATLLTYLSQLGLLARTTKDKLKPAEQIIKLVKIRTQKGIGTILAETGLTQSQLAELTGAALDTVKSWTRKNNPSPVSPEFETRILIATGAVIRSDGSVTTSWRVGPKCGLANKPFSKAAFEFWIKEGNKPAANNSVQDELIAAAVQGIELLLNSAQVGQARIAGQNNFAAVIHEVERWIGQTAEDFNLEAPFLSQLNALPKEKRLWRTNPGKAKLLFR